MAQRLKDESTCSICLQIFTDPVYLSCSHSFCWHCLEQLPSMSEDRGIECPLCRAVSQRAPLREVQLEQISLCLKQHWGLIKTELLISDEMRSMWEDVRLDPGTAHSLLLLSSDLKSVRYGTMCHNTEPDARRVTQLVSVLGSPSFSRGCHYWEVEVGEGHEWALGVCRDSVDRQCKGDVSCEQGFWIISKQAGEIRAHSLQPRILRASPGLHRVGIFVNVELEVVKFFDAANNSYLYMYKSVPSCEPLRPFFSPGPPREGATAVPLRICQ